MMAEPVEPVPPKTAYLNMVGWKCWRLVVLGSEMDSGCLR